MKAINPPSNPFAWLAWALFGNEDDGPYGDLNWNPAQEQTLKRRVLWWFRNPAHNLCFYVIGVADRTDTVRRGVFPDDVFSPVDGWNMTVTFVADGDRQLPFISYIGWCKFYVGWRERGNFGIKLTRNKQ